MNRAARILLAVLLLFCLSLSIGATGARADTQGSATVTASSLYMRSEASTDSTAVTCVPYGTTVQVTGSSGDWYAVTYGSYSGYMLGQYLSFTADTSTSADTTAATPAPVLTTDTSASASSSSISVSAYSATGTVTGSAVNVRSGPDTSYTAIGSVSKNSTVTITGISGSWYQISYNGQTAYIISTYVSTGSSSADSTGSTTSSTTTTSSASSVSVDTSVTGTGTVTGNSVNVRSGPDTSYSALGSVNKNTTVTITGKSGNWYQVNYNGQTAYIISTYLAMGDSSSSSASTTTSTSTSTTSADTSVSGSGYINGDQVRLRAATSTSSTILAVMSKNSTVNVTGKSGDWYAVTYNGTSGYVYAIYVTMGTPAASTASTSSSSSTTSSTSETISVDSYTAYAISAVNMRTGADTSYTSLHVLDAGTSVTVIGTSGSWSQVLYNNENGYIYSTYLTTTNPATTANSSSSVSSAIVNEAKKYLGVPYVYGGTSPSGFDCSGFVYYVFRQCGYTITRTATSQNSDGSAVSRDNLQPGDIIIFYNSAKTGIGHSGIYIGNNQFIHASSGGGKVMISSLSETYYNTRFYSARRVA